MVKRLIALNPKNQDLSSADFNKGLEQYNQPKNYLKTVIDTLKKQWAAIEQQRQAKLQAQREAEQAREEEERQKVRQAYCNKKIQEAENLIIAYAILGNIAKKIVLIPNFKQQDFINTVTQQLSFDNFQLLADKVYAMSESLNNKLNEIRRHDNPELIYQYYRYDKNYENITCNNNGDIEITYGAMMPTLELLKMEAESDLLSSLADELNGVVETELEAQQWESIKQTLEA